MPSDVWVSHPSDYLCVAFTFSTGEPLPVPGLFKIRSCKIAST